MKKTLIATMLFVLSQSAWANVKVEAEFWTMKCDKTEISEPMNCDIPQSLGPKITESLSWSPVVEPGQISRASKDFQIAGFKEKGKLTIYNVYPKIGSSQPKYHQVRFEWINPARGLCVQSVRGKAPIEIPPLMCSAWLEASKTMHGVTLVFTAE